MEKQHEKPNMEVNVLSSTIIPHVHGEPKEIPLTIFDRYAYNFHVACMFAYSPPTATNAVVIDALVKTLDYYPTLTGRLGRNGNGHLCIFLGGGGGALLVEAEVSLTLADIFPFEPSRDNRLLYPTLEDPTPEHLLQVQITRFACGGLVIGVTNHHRVADGQSMSNFFVAWARTARGLSTEPIASYERSWLNPRKPPKCEFQHCHFIPTSDELWANSMTKYLPHKIDVDSNKITNVTLHYSVEYISALKSRMKPENKRYTTFETLAGDLWRKITIARGLHGDQQTITVVMVDGRSRLQPPAPREYFGNLAISIFSTATADELIEGGFQEAARIISEAVRKAGDDYFQSFIDFGELHGKGELVPVYELLGNMLSPSLEISSWLRFQFNEIDFGRGGKLCGILPTWVPLEGVVNLLPCMCGDGGINAIVSLLDEDADMLKHIAHAID